MIVGIIGGGAAGLMAAATLLEKDPSVSVHLFERNSLLGQKIMISGGGRCNVTTGISDIPTVLSKYPRGANFLKHAMYGFPPMAVYEWFENHGTLLKTESDLRVFPRSDDGKDIVGVFRSLFEKYPKQVKVHFNCRIGSLAHEANSFLVHTEQEGTISCDKLIIATGGQAYRHTGSSGDGYTLAEMLGHHTTPLAPSLHSFVTKEEWPKSLSGLSFGVAHLTLKGEKQYAFDGPFLFTHKGISGPAVFALSSQSAYEALNADHPLHLTIDFLPMEKYEDLGTLLLEKQRANPKMLMKNILDSFLPSSLAATMSGLFDLDGKTANSLSPKTINKLRDFLKAAPLTLVGKGVGDEFVTAGGLDTTEIQSKTMESRLIPGLFFAGEILNVDGYTGGFNLQAAWATGHLAGEMLIDHSH